MSIQLSATEYNQYVFVTIVLLASRRFVTFFIYLIFPFYFHKLLILNNKIAWYVQCAWYKLDGHRIQYSRCYRIVNLIADVRRVKLERCLHFFKRWNPSAVVLETITVNIDYYYLIVILFQCIMCYNEHSVAIVQLGDVRLPYYPRFVCAGGYY